MEVNPGDLCGAMAPFRVGIIVGETGSGKSELAAQLAARATAMSVSADPYCAYRGMSIGTARPPAHDGSGRPVGFLDVRAPSERPPSPPEFLAYCQHHLRSARTTGSRLLIEGGDIWYMSALLLGASDYRDLRSRIFPRDRDRPAAAQDSVVGVPSEVGAASKGAWARKSPNTSCRLPDGLPVHAGEALIIRIRRPWDDLRRRIRDRAVRQVQGGLEGEVRAIAGAYGSTCHGMGAIGYREWRKYLHLERIGDAKRARVLSRIVAHTLRLARWQRVWLDGLLRLEAVRSRYSALETV